MTRHINLMQPDMLPGHGRVQLPTYLVALSLTLLGCLSLIGYHWSMQRSMAAEIQQWEAKVDTSSKRLTDFQRENPTMIDEAELMQENKTLNTQLRQRKEALSGLNDQLGEAAQGFAQPLATLSDYDLDGLWLTRIVLRDSQQHLNLEGFARQPNLIPQYLDQLQGSIFDGLGIQNMSIKQTSNNDSLWQFYLADQLVPAATEAEEER